MQLPYHHRYPYSPIIDRPDYSWPDGKRLAVYLGLNVEHFAFGPCDVLKSDGDRLHLRVHKDGRMREIALEMLRVTPLETSGGEGARRSWSLKRKM